MSSQREKFVQSLHEADSGRLRDQESDLRAVDADLARARDLRDVSDLHGVRRQ